MASVASRASKDVKGVSDLENSTNLQAFFSWITQDQYSTYLLCGQKLVNLECGLKDVLKFKKQNLDKVITFYNNPKTIQQGVRETKENGIQNFDWCAADISNFGILNRLMKDGRLGPLSAVNVFNSQNSLHLLAPTVHQAQPTSSSLSTSSVSSLMDEGKIDTEKTNKKLSQLLDWIGLFLTDDGHFIGTCSMDTHPELFVSRKQKDEINSSSSSIGTTDTGTVESLRLVVSQTFEELYQNYPNQNLSKDELKYAFQFRSFIFQKVPDYSDLN